MGYPHTSAGAKPSSRRAGQHLGWNLAASLALSLVLISCQTSARSDLSRPPTRFYIATGGKDANPGTLQQPFATLERARDAVRALKRAGGLQAPGVEILLAGGVYPRQDTFRLEAQDSGTPEAPIVYRAAEGASVVLSGGLPLETSWFTPVSDPQILQRIISPEARSQVLWCDLKAHGIRDYGVISRHGYCVNSGLMQPMELLVNGERQCLARWPNPQDPAPEKINRNIQGIRGVVCRSGIIDPGPKHGDADFLKRGGTISYSFNRPEFWKNATDIWISGIFNQAWEWSYNRVGSIDPVKKQLTLAYGEYNGIVNRYAGDFFFVENLLEEIDEPGEYYLDRTAGRLYFLPPPEFPKARVSVSNLSVPMIQVKGTSALRFEDLVLEAGRALAMGVEGGSDVRIEHCEIRQFAGAAMSVAGRNHQVNFSHIHHIGGTGIYLNGGNSATLEPGNCVAENNDIHDVGYYAQVYAPAISLGAHSVGHIIRHNRLHELPHIGLGVSGNDHRIEYNEFFHVTRDYVDMGAIYINLGDQPLERGTLIRQNYFHDIGNLHGGQDGVYPDNQTHGIIIEENIFARIGSTNSSNSNRSVHINGGSWNIARHNLFVDCSMPIYTGPHGVAGEYLKRFEKPWNAIFQPEAFAKLPHAKKYPELANFLVEQQSIPKNNQFIENLIYNSRIPRSGRHGKTPVVNGACDGFGMLEQRGNLISAEDPGFVDYARGNLTLRRDAAVYKQIPNFPVFEPMGLQAPVGPRAPSL